MSGLIGASPFLSRAEWGARAAEGSSGITPAGNTTHYEGNKLGTAYGHEKCNSIVRGIQAYHMDSNALAPGGAVDIAYSSLICIHGYIYEGRWLGRRTAANGDTRGNQISYAHCGLIGPDDEPPAALLRGLHDVVLFFEQHNSGKNRWCHKDWFNTACPGVPLCTYTKSSLSHSPTPTPTPTPTAPDDFRKKVMAKPVLEEGAGAPGGGRENQAQDVRIMQGLMLAHGATPISESGQIDGRFSNVTRQGLTAWQQRTKVLPADGRCSSDDWAWFVGV